MGPIRQVHARRRLGVAVVAAFAAATLVLSACGSSDDGSDDSAARSTTDRTGTTSTVAPPTVSPTGAAEGSLRTKRYCEVLLVETVDGRSVADVYNSFPLNDCPDDLWTQLDARTIAAASGASIAVLNGPRYWLMDRIEKSGGVEDLPTKDFGGIEMYHQATVDIGSMVDAATPYRVHAVNRSAVFTFDAGRTVYELSAPGGETYVMQTWSQQRDPALAEVDLAGLGARLQLPDGWTFNARVLEEPLYVDTGTVAAQVVQDDLGNSYSQIPS